jgi:hypothetical protein
MERLIELLEAMGYPEEGISWLRRHRLLIIIGLAGLSWLVVGILAWAVWVLVSSI